jgi:hypothetical protein
MFRSRSRLFDHQQLASRARKASSLNEPLLSANALARLALKVHGLAQRRLSRGGTLDERTLVIAHGIFLEAIRRHTDLARSMRAPALMEMVSILNHKLSDLTAVPHSHNEANRFAKSLQ